MIKEIADYYGVLQYVHKSIDSMLNDLTAVQWVDTRGEFNNIASIVDHITAVETGFMKILAGESIEKMPAESFRNSEWNIQHLKTNWNEALLFSKEVLTGLTKENLEEKVDLGLGMDMSKRQLIIFTISHLTHHRGQIPLIKKVLSN
ncbi:DinB family protein [Planococcus lenghuensis]|uniref:Damage-inducible protein DinB n=1 Tax=Planococcus lenghuensis TaxID=2213202 RepID=A0A1Q2L528_9BACL|nr:DinB family protein [Planococcus lenghuensis]AQQ55539.1 hypothetical protein B0X71_20405 [Planococcus lenghuensis]